MVQSMNEAWNLAQSNLKKAQKKQKKQHDRNADFKLCDRVYVFMPATKTGPAYKLALQYKGPYCVVQLYENGAELQMIYHPRAQTLRVALNRHRRSPSPEPYKQPAAVAQGTTSPAQDSVNTTPPGNPDPEPVETTLLVNTELRVYCQRVHIHNLIRVWKCMTWELQLEIRSWISRRQHLPPG
jgi:hypothetical protein